MPHASKSSRPPKATDRADLCPTAWFAVLETAIRSGDTARAEAALRKLNELGVHVSILRPLKADK